MTCQDDNSHWYATDASCHSCLREPLWWAYTGQGTLYLYGIETDPHGLLKFFAEPVGASGPNLKGEETYWKIKRDEDEIDQ